MGQSFEGLTASRPNCARKMHAIFRIMAPVVLLLGIASAPYNVVAQSQYRLAPNSEPAAADVLPPIPDPVTAAAPPEVRRVAASIPPADVMRLFVAILHTYEDTIDPSKTVNLHKAPEQMPAGAPYFYYAGRDAEGRMVFWEATGLDQSGVTPTSSDMLVTALGPAAADSGKAGGAWKLRYDNAPDKLVLAQAIALAFRMMVDGMEIRANADVSWIESVLRSGMPRQTTYSLLKSHALVAFNEDYNPGVPSTPEPPIPGRPGIGGGCSYRKTDGHSHWPYFREPLPARHGECAALATHSAFVPNPTAYIDLAVGMTLSCGVSRIVSLRYDMNDRLKAVRVDAPSVTCL